MSVPTSPRSITTFSHPSSPRATITRSDTVTSSTSSTIHPHHSISRIFLNASPILFSPPPVPPPKHASRPPSIAIRPPPGRAGKPRVRPVRTRRIMSNTSDYHLNLGATGGEFELSVPGPSPPNTGGSTPTRRTFIASQPRRVIRPKVIPSSPLTPSRAPPKAVKLLGTNVPTVSLPTGSFGRCTHSKKKDHFRPLPTQTLVDIEKFFGEVPKKVRPVPKALKGGLVGVSGPDGVGDRNVGEGGEVRYKGHDGNMWLDVQEEQEFAWLMSDVPAVPSPLPLPLTAGSGVSLMKGVEGVEDGYEVVFEETSENEGEIDKWGMETFQSVLNMPKVKPAPKSIATGNKKEKMEVDVKMLTSKGKGKTNKGFREIDESFMDFGDSKPTKSKLKVDKPPRLVVPDTIHPWSTSTDSLGVITPTRSDSASSSSSSPPSPNRLGTPPLPPLTRSESPPRIKNRPPPLTLRPGKKNPNLPILSTTPDPTVHPVHLLPHSHSSSRVSQTPITPFVRPRPAPVPSTSSIPAIPAIPALPPMPIAYMPFQPTPLIPSIPSLPPMRALERRDDAYYDDPDYEDDYAYPGQYGPNGRTNKNQLSKAARLMGLDPLADPTMQNVSFFEPDSPTERTYGQAGRGGLGGKMGMRGGAGWLKKVVKKPLNRA